ncbi:amidohydrolase family protein [Steroidobacter sp.]|uniref:amidohydrolase family protein n=1 Tax=Steroidobacter sp. TaxID=1978227 RepID=UPI001A47D3C9|nr:amidohydrolase family protein [Steroidobacter sp.]MBL8267276.1 amidohydrolase family protein [Steroidobacter sp.]
MRAFILILLGVTAAVAQAIAGDIYIRDVTLIDGNGGAARSHMTVVVSGQRIVKIAPAASIRVPAAAEVIDARGQYLIPGLIDTNVHLSVIAGVEELAKYEDRMTDVILEAAQLSLKHGITTLRDSYGMLAPLRTVRDAIANGEVVGSRLLVAGNIVGWGGPFSKTFADKVPSSYFEERINDRFVEQAGEELVDMGPEQLRAAIRAYLAKGPDFIKYGATSHINGWMLFSPRAQTILVEETHRRGLLIETHAGSTEAMREAVLAGVDLIQHPEVLPVPIPDELVQLIGERKVICSLFPALDMRVPESPSEELSQSPARAPTGWEQRQARAKKLMSHTWRENARKLIASGCIVSVATDAYRHHSPEFDRAAEPDEEGLRPGSGTLLAIERLVDLGMSPAQALVAATRNGALACGALDKFGTIEVGKYADLLLLRNDPLASIRNIREQVLVMKQGQVIDRDRLPTRPIWSVTP